MREKSMELGVETVGGVEMGIKLLALGRRSRVARKLSGFSVRRISPLGAD